MNALVAGHQAGAELIAVQVGEQQFAIDIMSVREIRGWTSSTPLPMSPDFVLGMINLRGAVLSVIDLGARLGLGASNPGRSSVVVVVQVEDRQVGLLVDAVCDILSPAANVVQDVPDVGSAEVGRYASGVISADSGIITILSLAQIVPAAAPAAA
jgi:purine-binding chemotaxis protein CheW